MPLDNNNQTNKEILRLVTAGSVDDGKSTLIGRLLYDLDKVYDDQLAAIKKLDLLDGQIDFSLITDGLSAEREQKITIDVAYRYFTTPNRKYIIADVPGHEQYTRNMVTGASTANLAVILIDATKGLQIQSKRHLFLSTLLGINHLALIINKMDKVGYSEKIYQQIKNDIENFAAKLNIKDIEFIPASSLKGDMVVKRGRNLDWYGGHTVFSYLENLSITADHDLINFRFPIQYVLHLPDGGRGYAGTVAGGHITPGEEIIVLPSGKTSKIKKIIRDNHEQDIAFNPQATMITLADEIDASRGDMIVRPQNTPEVNSEFEAMIFWMSDEPLRPNDTYLLKHTTKTTRCFVNELVYYIDVNTLNRKFDQRLKVNDVGRVRLKTAEPIFYDHYQTNKTMGSFIIIDEFTGQTAGAGIIWRNIQTTNFLDNIK